MTIALLIIAYTIPIFAITMVVKAEVTQYQHEKIAYAIYAYGRDLIKAHQFEKILVTFHDMESFYKTFFRLWDWGCTRILPPEKYELIKPYLKEGE